MMEILQMIKDNFNLIIIILLTLSLIILWVINKIMKFKKLAIKKGVKREIDLVKVWEKALENEKYEKKMASIFFVEHEAILIKNKYIILINPRYSERHYIRYGEIKKNIEYKEYIRLKDMFYGNSEKEREEEKERIEKEKQIKKQKEEGKLKVEEEEFLKKEFKL